jgi:chaperone BCS1
VSSQYNPEDGDPLTGRVLFSPAPGNHLLFYKRRLVWLSRVRADNSPNSSTSAITSNMRRMESYDIQILGRSQQIARDLIHDAIDCARKVERSRLKAYISTYGYWRKLKGYSPRPFESVILPKGHAEMIQADIQKFIQQRAWYARMGIPYHRGYLFHGLPGSGKTSLISALAGALEMNLYVLNIAGENMSDERLYDMFMDIQPHSILLLEDVDAVTRNREAVKPETPVPAQVGGDAPVAEKKGVTLSGLLNCIDGIVAKDGALLFMTTNYKERLDPALIRPGRIDVQLEFGFATREQIVRLFKRFFPNEWQLSAVEFAATFPKDVTMAEVQQYLLLRAESVDKAFADLPRRQDAEVSRA